MCMAYHPGQPGEQGPDGPGSGRRYRVNAAGLATGRITVEEAHGGAIWVGLIDQALHKPRHM